MYEFIRGPLAWTSFSIFLFGTLFQVSRFFILSEKKERISIKSRPVHHKKKEDRFSKERIANIISRLRVSILGTHPIMVFVSLLFHVSIFFLPLFLLEHNTLLDVLWGVSFCPHVLSHDTADVITRIIFFCILFFLFRRIFLKRVRAITTFSDFYFLLLTAAPFITGYLAVHNIYDYDTLIVLHILSVELILVSIPFTKLVHMIFFFLNRIWIKSEHDFGSGERVW